MRELPNNLQAEQNFLGALLLDNDILHRLNVQLRPEHFYDPLHVQIFEAATRLISRAQLANPVTLKTFFHDHTGFGEDGAASYLGDLVDGVISISEAKDYADIVHQTFLRRELVRISDNVIHDAQNPDIEISAQTQIEAAEQHLFTLAEDDTAEQGLKSFDLVLTETINIAEAATKTEGSLSGVSTGLTGLNNLLGGLHKSDLVILAGRPAMGKTALATNIAFHAATTTRTDEKAVPVAFFSLEMSAEQLGTRILAERSGLDSENIRRGRMNDREFLALVESSEQISRAPFFIDDTPALSVSQMASRARRLKRTKGLGLIVVDYLQLLQGQLGIR
ncbi:MAG: DnaB-like helicase C-terminal domain-containing protein, partial [Candidatus Puniceispirillaceae bacterium]